MEQEIRFCELEGRRIAYATVGETMAALADVFGRYREHPVI